MENARESLRPLGNPAAGMQLQRATEIGFEALERQADEQIVWLGAAREGDAWLLPVLHDQFCVDLRAKKIVTMAGREVGPLWRILALHYLAISGRPEQLDRLVTFADLPTARSYAQVYHGRTAGRLCATTGRHAETLQAAAAALGGSAIEAGDVAFQFDIFPRLSLRLIWHAGDEEFPPSATLLLPANAESYLCSEDLVVLSECLVSRLGGRPF